LHKRVSAFTLIELLVVLSILSILMFIITPRFASIVNPERAKNFVLRLQSSLQYLNEKAILEQRLYLFNFDLDERRYYFTQYGVEEEEGGMSGGENGADLASGSSGRETVRPGDEDLGFEVQDRHLRPAQVPDRLEIERVRVVPGGEVASGRVTVPFTPNGMMFSFEMVFTVQDGRRYLMTGNSYSNRIRIFSAIPEDEEEEWRLLE
jgi:prepilin-type N-terminal cleavage/methylation domain-containing protein